VTSPATALQPAEAPDALQTATGLAKAGDERAFREVVELTHGTLYRLALHLLGDAAEAQDVVQETFLRAWGRLDELREPEATLGWLCRIARNLVRDRQRGWWLRRRAPLEPGIEELGARLAPGGENGRPDDQLAAAQAAAEVRAVIGGLPEKQRLVLLLREVDGMDYEQIGRVLEIPVGTVESRLHRARKALAERLKRREREEDGR